LHFYLLTYLLTYLLSNDVLTVAFHRISATLSCPMSLEKYPLDMQACPIMFESCELASYFTGPPTHSVAVPD